MTIELVNDVLNAEWDPIGVAGSNNTDEYLSYARVIDQLFQMRPAISDEYVFKHTLRSYLTGVQVYMMSIYGTNSQVRIEKTVDALMSL